MEQLESGRSHMIVDDLKTSANWKNLSSPTLKRQENVEQQNVNTVIIRNVKCDFVMCLWSKIFLTELNVSR